MQIQLLPRLGLFAICVLGTSQAFAETTTAQFGVTITITSECKINSASNLNFGSSGVISSAIAAESDIAVQCTNGTPYDLELSAGSGTGATVANRLMTGADLETVSYSLYIDSGHASVWGYTPGQDTVSNDGTGMEQTYKVYGQVPAQATPKPGQYNDTVTVTLTY